MFTIKAAAAFALTAITLIACGAAPDGSEATGATESAVKAGALCQTDSNCNRGLVCDPICPIIPGRAHCETLGGTCEPICELTKAKLEGTTFTSADGAHTITFNDDGTFTQKDGCPISGNHCNSIKLTVGKFSSNGTTITLVATLGGRDTMTVDPHCYAGLLDNADGVELYPVYGSN